MKINTGDNKKVFFFYLILVDFIIAMQIAAVSFLQIKSSDFFLSFIISFLVFLAFSEIFKSSRKIESIMRPGMIFMILGSLINFFPSDASFFALGRAISGLGAGMVMASQIGMIWHDDSEEMKNFSVVILFSFISGLIFGPALVTFLSGPALGEMKVVFVLGMALPGLAMAGNMNGIFTIISNTASDATKAFFDISRDDDLGAGAKKVAVTTARRIVYIFFDYWFSIACAALVGLLNFWGLSFWKVVFITWVFDFTIAFGFMTISEKSGQDITLGESFRRAAEAIKANSKIMGHFAFVYLNIKAIIWDGPEQVVIFFKKEIGGTKKMTLILVGLTFIQGFFWAWVYSLGYENVSELIRNIS
ncbi:MAG: hypothetical protein Q7U36_01410 [bacterium]|nr:hypothetical protein [bacterium]